MIADATGADARVTPPLELTPDLCNDASNMDVLLDSLSGGDGNPSFGSINLEQLQRMIAAPTEGPFYMVNLIRFRDMAVYPDGRETDLTGREANDLYSPVEFISAIGAQPVFVGDVGETTLGMEGTWHQVAIVQYPCPIALFAMSAHPEFQERSIHKEAGVEATIVMVTHLQQLGVVEPVQSPHPPTAEDPTFESVDVFRYHDQAQYAPGSGEPSRTGQEAMDLYASSIRAAELRVGVVPKARLLVQGVFIGDGRAWDEVWIRRVPSGAARDALVADSDYLAAQHHRDAAIDEGYGMTVIPLISIIPAPPTK